jgi:UDP:flavonoid glycosyltransferase YjiC (YdhE family)
MGPALAPATGRLAVSVPSRRLLFAAAGGHGHLQPLLPLAKYAVRLGHAVLVTGAASLGKYATAQGLSFAASGSDLVPIKAPLTVHDVDTERRAVASYFVARLGHSRAKALLDLCSEWQPDVIVRDEVDFGAAVAAETASLPHVPVTVIGAGGFILSELVNDPLNSVLAEFGAQQAGFEMLHRHLTLTPFPLSFRDPAHPISGPSVNYHVPPPPRPQGRSTGGRVLVTLGTIFNTESGDLLRDAALGAAASPGVESVTVATGEHLDPASLGSLPAHVRVERFVNQDEVLAESDAVISHGGSGTVLGALKQGLPMVTLAMGADQHLNSERLQELGLGVSLPADKATVQDISGALDAVLASQTMRQRLREVREELDRDTSLRSVEQVRHDLVDVRLVHLGVVAERRLQVRVAHLSPGNLGVDSAVDHHRGVPVAKHVRTQVDAGLPAVAPQALPNGAWPTGRLGHRCHASRKPLRDDNLTHRLGLDDGAVLVALTVDAEDVASEVRGLDDASLSATQARVHHQEGLQLVGTEGQREAECVLVRQVVDARAGLGDAQLPYPRLVLEDAAQDDRVLASGVEVRDQQQSLVEHLQGQVSHGDFP